MRLNFDLRTPINMVALGKVKRGNLIQKESPNTQYFCFSGITPLMSPLGFGVSPCLRGMM